MYRILYKKNYWRSYSYVYIIQKKLFFFWKKLAEADSLEDAERKMEYFMNNRSNVKYYVALGEKIVSSDSEKELKSKAKLKAFL